MVNGKLITFLGVLTAMAALLPCPALAAEPSSQHADPHAAIVTGDPRRPKDDNELRFWLENMIWHHRFSEEEIAAATGLSTAEIRRAVDRFKINADTKPKRTSSGPLLVLPYPGGRHPRLGFRDGAVTPQRETKLSVFTPWDDASYVVVDVPEAIWSNLGLTYLAHTHVPTIWTRQKIELAKLEWQRHDDGSYSIERRLPNGITFATKAVADRTALWLEMSLANGTRQTLTNLRVQNCVMLARAAGFEQQTNDNKRFIGPYVAVRNDAGNRWIVTAWDPVHRPWANPPCPCLHSDPKFLDCPPGKTRYIRGLVTFYAGNDIEQFCRELDDLGWRDAAPDESSEALQTRLKRVAERRAGLQIICHRGAQEFAHENTLEAYRATFELGGDGNEIDVRQTKDGQLVCFHDDMLDRILDGYGDVSDYTWNELQQFAFRRPRQFAQHCRIPTLVEVLELHRRHGGLVHLDLKRPGMDGKIAQLLDQLAMWDHVVAAPADSGAAVTGDHRYRAAKYKRQLYEDDHDVNPVEIAKVLSLPGDAVMVDDPRAVILATSRQLGHVSSEPAAPRRLPWGNVFKPWPDYGDLSVDDCLRVLEGDGDHVEWTERTAQTRDRIARAIGHRELASRVVAIEALARRQHSSAEIFEALARCVENRTVTSDWRTHGLDGAAAQRALVTLKFPQTAAILRTTLWRDDSELDRVNDPKFNVPRSWVDWRMKSDAWALLRSLPGDEAAKICIDYLKLSLDQAKRHGPIRFADAAETLLLNRRDEATAIELLQNLRPAVRNRTIKVGLRHIEDPWARSALEKHAPHALAYVPPPSAN